MVELVATEPFQTALPLAKGQVTLSSVPLDPMWSIAPFAGKTEPVSEALGKLGVSLPATGRSVSKSGIECVWFSRGEVMLIGAQPPEGLAEHAAVTDQSDSWAVCMLKGAPAEAVLARLIPLDLRQATFKRGHTARSLLNHMPLHLTRTANDAFRLMTFRSMASTMVHELSTTMGHVAARG